MRENASVSIAELANGEVVERVDKAILDVVANILDENTEAVKKREIILKLTFEPGKNRDIAEIGIAVSTRLAEPIPAQASIIIGKSRINGKPEVRELGLPGFCDE